MNASFRGSRHTSPTPYISGPPNDRLESLVTGSPLGLRCRAGARVV